MKSTEWNKYICGEHGKRRGQCQSQKNTPETNKLFCLGEEGLEETLIDEVWIYLFRLIMH